MVEASQWRCISDGDDPSRNAVNGETYQLTCGWTLQQQADVRSRLANGRRGRQGRGGGCAIKVDEKQHMQNHWAFVFYPFLLLLYSVRDSPSAYEERESFSVGNERNFSRQRGNDTAKMAQDNNAVKTMGHHKSVLELRGEIGATEKSNNKTRRDSCCCIDVAFASHQRFFFVLRGGCV